MEVFFKLQVSLDLRKPSKDQMRDEGGGKMESQIWQLVHICKYSTYIRGCAGDTVTFDTSLCHLEGQILECKKS